MKKMMKKLAAGAMAAAVVLGGVAASPVSVKAADSYTAQIGFTDSSWTYQNWTNSVEVTGDGEYTITLTAADVGATDGVSDVLVFVIDFLEIDYYDIVLDDIHVYADGTEVSVDASKVLTGNIEDQNTNYRIEIYNTYGDTAADAPLDTNLAWSDTLSVTFTVSNTGLGSATTDDSASTDDSSSDDSATTDDDSASNDDDSATTDDDSSSDDDSASNDDSSSSSNDDTTGTGDVAPIAAVAVLLAGCAVILVASRKRA